MFRFAALLFLAIPFWVQASTHDLLLITIDTLRADRLGSYGYQSAATPNLDSLAKQSLFFEQAFCTAPLTLPSHTTLLTGRYPHHHGTHDNAGKVRSEELTLAEILKARGYSTYAFVGGFPLEHRFGLNQGFDIYDDTFPREPNRPLDFGTERNAEAVIDAFLKTQRKSPNFTWIHLYDPHAPYHNGGYDGEIAYVDRQIGRLLRNIDQTKTIIAVAGDHGEGLGEHREQTHRIFIYDSTMHVPFWIGGPGITPQRVKNQVSLVDFLPTILNVMDVQLPDGLDGVVLPQNSGKPAIMESMFPQLQLGWSALNGVRTPEWKLIRSAVPELYDLKNDPQETKNIYPNRAETVKTLLAYLPKEAPIKSEPVSPEMAEQLAALGYIGGSSSANTGKLPDPKTKIEVWNNIEVAADLQYKHPAKSIELLELARKSDASNPMILSFLADLYTQQKRFDDAHKALDQLLKRDPANSSGLLRMARLSLRQNQPAEALKIAGIMQKKGEASVEVELLAANANLKLGKKNVAAEHLKKALQIDPGDYATRIDLANLYAESGNMQSAVAEFKIVLDQDRENVQALNGLATIAFAQKDLIGSERYLKEALSVAKDDPQTKMNLALVYANSGRNKQAVALYQQVKDDPSTPQDWRNLATARLKELQP